MVIECRREKKEGERMTLKVNKARRVLVRACVRGGWKGGEVKGGK